MFRRRETKEEWQARARLLPGEDIAAATRRIKAQNQKIYDEEEEAIERFTKKVDAAIEAGMVFISYIYFKNECNNCISYTGACVTGQL